MAADQPTVSTETLITRRIKLMKHPTIIQGGMGVAVSNWRLARAVSIEGGLGVISGTLLGVVMARRLADGDREMRRALEAFPFPAVAGRILDAYYSAEGKRLGSPYPAVPMPTLRPSSALTELIVAACFAEVFLAKEGHDGVVGMNLLEKIQLPTLPSLYGAMLAGVDYILMGAGIPRAIPRALDLLAENQPAELRIECVGSVDNASTQLRFDPREVFGAELPALRRPAFLAVVSSAAIASTLAKKATGRVDGFVVEAVCAGGHNAPPRGELRLNARGEPVYGPRDLADLEKIKELGLPFWLAGSMSSPEKLRAAQALGAEGIQVGTPLAFAEESGITPELKARVRATSYAGTTDVFTDPSASPTGFPFKVAQLEGTLSDAKLYSERQRICDLGYLREPYRRADGSIAYRCSAEPVEDYVAKGGASADCVGRKCLCNALLAAVGLPQTRGPYTELPVVTAGSGLGDLLHFTSSPTESYSAKQALDVIRGKASLAPASEQKQQREALCSFPSEPLTDISPR